MSDTNLKQQIEASLAGFAAKPLATAALELFGTLGYKSERRLQLRPATAKGFLTAFDPRQELSVTLKKELIGDGVLQKDAAGVRLLFTRDYEFSSPSAAASMIAGNPENGVEAWGPK